MADYDILEIEYFSGSMPPVSGSMPFGYFEGDSQFQQDAPKIGLSIARHLGFPVSDLEVTNENIYGNIERAMMQFSSIMNEYKSKENYHSLLGLPTGSNISDKLIYPNISHIIRLSEAYGTEANVGGSVPIHTGSIELTKGKQFYNLTDEYFSTEHAGAEGSEFTIRKIFHQRVPASVVGTGYGSSIGVDAQTRMITQFDFGDVSYSNYYTLLPLSWDVQRMQAVEMAREIRTSAYSFELNANLLRIFPIPRRDMKLFFHYTLKSQEQGAGLSDTIYDKENLINDPTKLNFKLFQWSEISPRDRNWILDYAEALTKITLGENRRKFSSFQYPSGDVSLNGEALVSEGIQEKEALKTEMKEYLDSLSKERGMEIEQRTAEAQSAILRKIPLGIYRIK